MHYRDIIPLSRTKWAANRAFASGMTEAEILVDFPDLTADDLRACLAFAAERERRLYSSAA